jgi:hypothetical protein
MKQFNSEVEMIEHVVTKLDEQGCKSASGNGKCKYNGPNGRHCAAGWLMTDDELGAVREDKISSDCGVDFGEHGKLARMLQIYHDECWIPSRSTFRTLLTESTTELPGLIEWRATQKRVTADD